MATVSEIQQAILALSDNDYVQFRQWFSELDWKRWDEQIEGDSREGKLDFLVVQALESKSKGALLDL